MKGCLVFLLAMLMPLVAVADGEYYTTEAEQIVDSSQQVANELRKEYEELEKQILKLDPDYAKQLKSKYLTDSQKLTMARSYLAQKAFDYYKDSFMKELEQRSQETGRRIVTQDFSADTGHNYTEKIMWLDRGELDTDECMRDGWQICKYPDGFEGVDIDLQESSQRDGYGIKALFGNNNTLKSIKYQKDMPNNNATQYCDITMSYQSTNNVDNTNSLFEETLSLDVYCDVQKYDEYYAWLNQEVEDTINGKHDIIGYDKLPDGRVGIIERQSEDFSKWKSNNNIPGGHILGRDYEYHRSISKSEATE